LLWILISMQGKCHNVGFRAWIGGQFSLCGGDGGGFDDE
jgi:hypothetical protein